MDEHNRRQTGCSQGSGTVAPSATAFVTTCFGFHLAPKRVDGGKSVRVIAIAYFVSHSLSSHLDLFSYLPFSSHLIVSDHLPAHPPIVPYRIMPFNRFPSISRCLLLHWTAHSGVTVDFFAASCPAITVHHGHRKHCLVRRNATPIFRFPFCHYLVSTGRSELRWRAQLEIAAGIAIVEDW